VSRLRKTFGLRLREVRLARGLTQEQLAEKLDVSLNFLNLIERGERAPSFVTLERITKVLRTPAAAFFLTKPSENPPGR
jgi:transcriptional regulator with XRE-family HTH domain